MRTFIAVFALALLPFSALAQVLYGATGGAAPSNLYRINTTTGAAIVVGPIGHGLSGMAQHPFTGVMYGATTNSPACPRCLVTVNLGTGAGTVIGPLGQNIAELAFAPNGVLWGWTESGDNLARIDIATGVATTVGASGIGTYGDGLTFRSGVLYVMPDGDTGNVYSMDLTTGVATLGALLTGSPQGTGQAVSAATTQPGTNVVFASIQNFGAPPANLVTVNLTTGVITNVGVTVTGLDALEFAAPAPFSVPHVPTLSEWAMLLLASVLMIVGVLRLRRRG